MMPTKVSPLLFQVQSACGILHALGFSWSLSFEVRRTVPSLSSVVITHRLL
jgi:hypothetical protein